MDAPFYIKAGGDTPHITTATASREGGGECFTQLTLISNDITVAILLELKKKSYDDAMQQHQPSK